MTSDLALSIVIPTHQRPALLRRAVASVLASPRADIEALVVEDNATSASEALREWADDERLTVISSTGPRGASATRNAGVDAARAPTVLFLDDDDELVTQYIDTVTDLAGRPELSWGFSRTRKRSDTDALDHGPAEATRLHFAPITNGNFRQKIGGSGAGFWIRKDVFTRAGGFCETQVLDEDTDLCCRLISTGLQPCVCSPCGVVIDRDSSVTRLTSQTLRDVRAECYFRTFQRNFQALECEPGAQSYLALRTQRKIVAAQRADLLERMDALVQDAMLRLKLRSVRPLLSFRYRFL
ncbi:MAG: glycosyltransferase family 2 protein [Roseinatronobacter sp.]